jgi:NO-binding membrane sensor protein with MHYT domain
MVGSYDYWLVLLSVVVAIAASFVALDLAARVSASSQRSNRVYWLAAGALSMGTGIWSMHFIGMLAFRLPVPVSYDVPITLASLLIAITASWFALRVAGRETLSHRRLAAAGLLMGFAIVSMHYVGMEAMRMEPPIRYRPPLVYLSIAIAVAASLIALWCAFKQRAQTIISAFWNRAGSAVVMGIAIVPCRAPYRSLHLQPVTTDQLKVVLSGSARQGLEHDPYRIFPLSHLHALAHSSILKSE